MPTSRFAWLGLAVLSLVGLLPESTLAQKHAWHDKGFAYRRTVEIQLLETVPSIAVVDFFTHGAVDSRSEVSVFGNREAVASRVLQTGPGDYCRIAFQPLTGETRYYVYYGGRREEDPAPAWEPVTGLYFETRRWHDCDLNELKAVQTAFAGASRFGADLVGEVHHRHNPFDLAPRPFLSHYSGNMEIAQPGLHVFYTSSQDCSFVVVDGQVVVAAPGKHPPETQAKIKGQIMLTAGKHRFDYWHASSGDETCMAVYWQIPGLKEPSRISPRVFGFDRVARGLSLSLEHREDGILPDFRVAIVGEIPPAADDEPAMIRAQLADMSPPQLVETAKHYWEFSDGQTSGEPNPGHIFLHSGVFAIRLSLERRNTAREITYRVPIPRPVRVNNDDPPADEVTAYLKLLEQYNAQNLDPISLLQVVRAYVAAGDFDRAVRAGERAFASDADKYTDEVRLALARILGSTLRNSLDRPGDAGDIWTRASRLIRHRPWQVYCAVEGADVLINDALDAGRAQPLLTFVGDHLADASTDATARYYRVAGDFAARAGNGEEARRNYHKAADANPSPYNSVEQTAWRGAHSRSVEAFLFGKELDRAREELDAWLLQFPAEKIDSYWPLLRTRLDMEQEKYQHAVVTATDALTTRPNSPYADQLTFLIAESQNLAGNGQQAAATYARLLSEYPGSPLVPKVRARLSELKN